MKLWRNHGDAGNEFSDPEEDNTPAKPDPVFLSPTGTASMQDGMLEVVAVNGIVHLGQLQVCHEEERHILPAMYMGE